MENNHACLSPVRTANCTKLNCKALYCSNINRTNEHARNSSQVALKNSLNYATENNAWTQCIEINLFWKLWIESFGTENESHLSTMSYRCEIEVVVRVYYIVKTSHQRNESKQLRRNFKTVIISDALPHLCCSYYYPIKYSSWPSTSVESLDSLLLTPNTWRESAGAVNSGSVDTRCTSNTRFSYWISSES